MKRHYLACDLGAESGRVMLAGLESGKLTLEEIHRFPNTIVNINGSLHWDASKIFEELKKGLLLALEKSIPIAGLSVDSWGVDYVLLDEENATLCPPFHYRDKRTDEVFPRIRDRIGSEVIFAETGIQFLPFNTLYQLVAEMENDPARFAQARTFLTIGDYFNFLFSGVVAMEESLASTTQLYNPATRKWSEEITREAGLPLDFFPKIVPSGTVLGRLLPNIADEPLQVIATCSHDTGAAVAAVPAPAGNDWAYLSSGTWSLLGVELEKPLISEQARELNFTNEAGFGGTTRFLKNIVGLWILQECRRDWAGLGKNYEYGWLNEQAASSEPLRSLIDPSDDRFMKPDRMLEKVAAFCRETGQPVPETPGETTRCILESLALLYRRTIGEIELLTGRTIQRIHIVGGGSQSLLLNQFTADATGRTVLAGPVEATAIGNVLVQAIALGHLESLTSARQVVTDSFSPTTYLPKSLESWDKVCLFDTTII